MTPASIRLVPWGVKLQSAHTRLPWWGAAGSEALVGCSPWTLHPQPGVLPCGVTDVPCRAVLSLADPVARPAHGPCIAPHRMDHLTLPACKEDHTHCSDHDLVPTTKVMSLFFMEVWYGSWT